MSEYSEETFAKDFAERTLKNLINYSGEYEVTQLINSAIGLLMIPKEEFFNEIIDNIISCQLLKKMREAIDFDEITSKNKKNSLKNIVIHIRNGIAHGHMKFISEDVNGYMEIQNVIIWG